MIDDADFMPNPARAIWIEGEINEALVDRLEPQIAKLTSQSSEAITLYINSGGGLTRMVPRIVDLLIATDQPGMRCNRTIIAVGTERAGSAAAQLLSIADRAYVRPGCALLYHGTRYHMNEAVTGGVAAMILEGTRLLDNWAIRVFIGSCARRFMFIVSALNSTLGDHRSDAGDPMLTDLECFQAVLRSKLSPSGQEVLEKAARHSDRYSRIVAFFRKKMATRRGAEKTEVQKQRAMLSAAIQFEYQSGKSDPDWDLTQGGLSRITEHYCLLDEQLVLADADVFGKICEEFAPFAGFVEDHLPLAQKLTKTREFLEPFWGFFLAVCRALRDGENPLTPMDAVWLGLIDSVRDDATAEDIH